MLHLRITIKKDTQKVLVGPAWVNSSHELTKCRLFDQVFMMKVAPSGCFSRFSFTTSYLREFTTRSTGVNRHSHSTCFRSSFTRTARKISTSACVRFEWQPPRFVRLWLLPMKFVYDGMSFSCRILNNVSKKAGRNTKAKSARVATGNYLKISNTHFHFCLALVRTCWLPFSNVLSPICAFLAVAFLTWYFGLQKTANSR